MSYEPKNRIVLVGGFSAYITDAESNLWHEYVTSTPDWDKYIQSRDALSAALVLLGSGASSASAAGARAAMADEHDARKPLYGLAKSWHDKLLAARVEADDE